MHYNLKTLMEINPIVFEECSVRLRHEAMVLVSRCQGRRRSASDGLADVYLCAHFGEESFEWVGAGAVCICTSGAYP